MDIRFLSLGLFVNNEANNINLNFFHSDFLSLNFSNTYFHFDFCSENKEHYKIKITGGYFSPFEASTRFYYANDNRYDSKLIVTKIPSFFALLLPYPFLNIINSKTGYYSEEWANNLKPFKTMAQDSNSSKLKRFNLNTWNRDLAEKLVIQNNNNKHYFVNNFFENNCYPIFTKDPNEAIVLINDLAEFFNKAFGVDLNLQNISKVLIPFFEISNDDNLKFPEYGGDDLPF